MSAAVQPMNTTSSTATGGWPLQMVLRLGVLGGAVAIYLCLVGIVPVFADRPLIVGVVSLGQGALLATFGVIGFLAGRQALATSRVAAVLAGALAGAITGAFLTGLVIVGSIVDIRAVFLNASPELYALLQNGLVFTGPIVPTIAGLVTGALGGVLVGLRADIRSPLLWGLGSLFFFGLFGGLLRTPLLVTPLAAVARSLLGADGLTLPGAVVVFVATVVIAVVVRATRPRQRVDAMPARQRRLVTTPLLILLAVLVLLYPLALGSFFAQVIALVALFVLLGLGLNITLGLAGLLDLGFVAFYAVGAYTVALLTSTGPLGIAGLTFWQAVPFAVVGAMLFAIFLGLPILRIRGDYLAIATLGFGEIIRILAGSNLLIGVLGGPQGIINIPKPIPLPPTSVFAGPVQIYYISLIFAGVVAFVAYRLRGSRLGRSWMAIREDEDVAEGMGVNLVQTKLLAYMLGGAFAGLAGAISAGLVGAVFSSSIELQLSINVAAIVIVGGMGSIPGVVVGALILIGLPELFREFTDYRFLAYGIALMAIMIVRPEGLLPSRIARRELHVAEEFVAAEPSDLLEPEEIEESPPDPGGTPPAAAEAAGPDDRPSPPRRPQGTP
jgi:branched-chain amino acid transport system permease protein